jgi:hypothetical protein
MEYRGEEYSVVQGIGGHIWKWSTSIAGVEANGQAHSKAGAVAAAEKAIDRALAVKKSGLFRPGRRLMPSAC